MCYVTRWMLLVPRQTEAVGGRWFGLLGFAFHPVFHCCFALHSLCFSCFNFPKENKTVSLFPLYSTLAYQEGLLILVCCYSSWQILYQVLPTMSFPLVKGKRKKYFRRVVP